MNDTAAHYLSDADILCYSIAYGVNMLLAVHTAMEEGSSAADEYTDALYAVFDYLYDKQKDLRAAIDGLYAERKKEGRGRNG